METSGKRRKSEENEGFFKKENGGELLRMQGNKRKASLNGKQENFKETTKNSQITNPN